MGGEGRVGVGWAGVLLRKVTARSHATGTHHLHDGSGLDVLPYIDTNRAGDRHDNPERVTPRFGLTALLLGQGR